MIPNLSLPFNPQHVISEELAENFCTKPPCNSGKNMLLTELVGADLQSDMDALPTIVAIIKQTNDSGSMRDHHKVIQIQWLFAHYIPWKDLAVTKKLLIAAEVYHDQDHDCVDLYMNLSTVLFTRLFIDSFPYLFDQEAETTTTEDCNHD